MDVVKQRLQLRHSPYNGVLDCIQKTMKDDGLSAFYRSYRTTAVMNIPFTAVHFASYEAGKNAPAVAFGFVCAFGGPVPAEFADLYPEHADEEHLLMHITAGGAAGALASAVTTPLDVIKTRLQCQGVNGSHRYPSGSVLATAHSIVK